MEWKKLVALGAGLVALSGCQTKNAAVATSGDQQPTTEVGNADLVDEAAITEEDIQTLRQNFLRVNFDFDRTTLDADARDALAKNAEILLQHPSLTVRVEGHADHWGSDLYNLALGQRRAQMVFQYLTTLGVSEDQLELLSYGEEKPLVADQGDKQAERENRSAEFLVLNGDSVVASSY